ncbi:MAG: choice-of-anchor Q domain-containing protein [Rhizomicrobium sp.]
MPSITSNITFLNDRPGDGVIIIQGPASPRIRIFSVGPGTTVTFAGLTLTNGSSAIAMDNASVTVRNCYVTGHTSSAIVGNAFSSGIATLTVINSTFWNNSGGSGGAISLGTNTGGVVHATVTNSTFDSNSATSNFNPGSAINIVDNSNSASTLLLVNSTLAFNSSPSGGATVSTDRATVQTLNSIFVHSGSAGNFIVSGGSLVSLGHNLSDLPEGGDLGTGPGGFFNATGDKRNTNPQLGALQSYGGLTLTRAVAAGTPPADAGDDAVLSPPYSLTTDQRGAPRKSGAHIDIGAFEREVLPQSGPGFVVTTTADRDDGVCGAVDCTLRKQSIWLTLTLMRIRSPLSPG